MMIAHVISSCGPGGAEVFVKTLILHATKNKPQLKFQLWVMTRISDVYPTNIAALEFESRYISQLTSEGIDIKFINKKPNQNRISTLRKIHLLYAQERPEIIHAHSEEIAFYISVALWFEKCKIIHSIHSVHIRLTNIHRFLLKYRMSAYVAISEGVMETVFKSFRLDKNKLFVIYNDIDLERYYNDAFKVRDKVTRIVAIGRLTAAKNYPNLFQAVKTINQQLAVRNIKLPVFVIVGEGELREQLETLIDRSGLSNVKLLGLRTNIPAQLKYSDIYVMASNWEGLSISLIEALASGIPIVATDVGSNREIIQDRLSGTLVSPSKPERLANAIIELIESRDLRMSYSQNRKGQLKRFDLDECISRHFALYANYVGENKSKRADIT